MRFNWASKKWVNVLLHIVFWVVLFSLPSLLRPNRSDKPGPPDSPGAIFHFLVSCATWISLFYTNAYILIPRFVVKGRYSKFALSLLPLLVLLSFINWLSFTISMPERNFRLDGLVFFYLFPSLFFLAISTAWKLFNDQLTNDKIRKEKETENLKTELSFLRSQVSPHFMFNVLNNMVALARKKSDLLEPSLIKLSSLLRYMLYETDEEKVLLEKEIEYLQSYIDLQVQRFGKKVTVNVAMNDIDGSYYIEPMLLIPFVENAFKHGTGSTVNGEIKIELSAQNNQLHFMVSNSYCKNNLEIKDKTSGIGLQNVKRRLNLLYRQRHTLKIREDNNTFVVNLQLNLH